MKTVIVIDFCTINPVAAIYQNGKARVITNEYEGHIIPSAVYIDSEGEVRVGTAAKNVAVLHYDSTVLSVKRDIGTEELYRINEKEYLPEEIASFIIKTLKEPARRFAGKSFEKAVITVPGYFNDRRRKTMVRAAQMAGFEVLWLINEPTSADLAYGLKNDIEGIVAVYDLGGGTFDISLKTIKEGVF